MELKEPPRASPWALVATWNPLHGVESKNSGLCLEGMYELGIHYMELKVKHRHDSQE